MNELFAFSVDGVEEVIEGELVATKYIRSDTGVDRKPFCVDFKFPPGSNLEQAVYRVHNEGLGEATQMFLAPYAGDDTGWYMTAQFN